MSGIMYSHTELQPLDTLRDWGKDVLRQNKNDPAWTIGTFKGKLWFSNIYFAVEGTPRKGHRVSTKDPVVFDVYIPTDPGPEITPIGWKEINKGRFAHLFWDTGTITNPVFSSMFRDRYPGCTFHQQSEVFWGDARETVIVVKDASSEIVGFFMPIRQK